MRTLTRTFRLTQAWQHDGATFKVRAAGAEVERRFKRLVRQQADRLGIPTSLECEWL